MKITKMLFFSAADLYNQLERFRARNPFSEVLTIKVSTAQYKTLRNALFWTSMCDLLVSDDNVLTSSALLEYKIEEDADEDFVPKGSME